MADEIDVLDNADENVPSCSYSRTAEPIVIRGTGRLTIFGLSSQFETDFPAALTGRLAPEELQDTMQRINYVLQRKMRSHLGWLVCGVLFCCCTLSCSLWPLVCLNRRTVIAVEKALDYENQQLYNRLGLHLRLSRRSMEQNARLTEYVLLLETLPRTRLMIPD
ncbi:Cysteine-rich hydrophobic domain 2 protein [Aphelenchoides besseyi]|nr:Cysteine-rich hydrophobic domain 2 protein [Aphelenchoides besseyi]KAI6235279.1 Cysteine-rich hydrophobic domain 2 protein [Aphelenchoides besseyi]